MACGAITTELTFVYIVWRVARKTIHGRALIHAVHMAILTSYIHMRANQFEGGKVVIKTGRLPAIRCVTRGAIPP